ncbi:MAG TPA: hypothetical protein VMV13_07185 [Candidatus Binataceae bacterium]|nr:hypothetical protein [Candidatus Binataceae bacterium]
MRRFLMLSHQLDASFGHRDLPRVDLDMQRGRRDFGVRIVLQALGRFSQSIESLPGHPARTDLAHCSGASFVVRRFHLQQDTFDLAVPVRPGPFAFDGRDEMLEVSDFVTRTERISRERDCVYLTPGFSSHLMNLVNQAGQKEMAINRQAAGFAHGLQA